MIRKLELGKETVPGIVIGAKKTAQRRHNVKKALEALNKSKFLIDKMRESIDDVTDLIVEGDTKMIVAVLSTMRRCYKVKLPTSTRSSSQIAATPQPTMLPTSAVSKNDFIRRLSDGVSTASRPPPRSNSRSRQGGPLQTSMSSSHPHLHYR